MFNRPLSDVRIDILTDRIVENFSGYSVIATRKPKWRDFYEERWDAALARVDLSRVIQHRMDPFVVEWDASILTEVMKSTRADREENRDLYGRFGFALGTLEYTVRRQAEWAPGELEAAVETVVAGKSSAVDLATGVRDIAVLVAYLQRFAAHTPGVVDAIAGTKGGLMFEPYVVRSADTKPDHGREWAQSLLTSLANYREHTGAVPVETRLYEDMPDDWK